MDRETTTSSVRKITLLAAALVVCFIALTCCYQLRVTQAAVLTTFEKPVRIQTEAGLHMKFPWPIQKVYVFDTRTRLYQSPYFEYLVQDGFNVIVRVFLSWRIKDVGLYKNKVGVTLARGETIIATLLSKELKTVLSGHSFAELVGLAPTGEGGITAIENEILARISAEAAETYGIEVAVVGFDRLELPENTTAVVFERMKSERMKMVETILSQGQYEARKIRKEADSEKNRLLAEAEAEATRIRGEADTAAYEYLEVYAKHPEFALFLKKLRALERTLKTKTTIVLDRDIPPFDVLCPAASSWRPEPQQGKIEQHRR